VWGGGPVSFRNDLLSEHSVRTRPNPFVQQLNIEFALPGETEVRARVYDVTGRLVKKLYQGIIGNTGVLCWQGADEMGKMAPQGVYFLRIENPTTNTSICRKIIKID
jgi:hypothetical protein